MTITAVSGAQAASMPSKKALFAGGCFWCMESTFQRMEGVRDVTSGYTDDGVEAVEIVYDPQAVSYEQLLSVYWENIDPLDEGGQFYDRGHHYTTAIYVADDAERALAEASKAAAEKKLGQKVAPRIEKLRPFKPAAQSHQDFYEKNPGHYNRYRTASGRDKRFKELWGKDGGGH